MPEVRYVVTWARLIAVPKTGGHLVWSPRDVCYELSRFTSAGFNPQGCFLWFMPIVPRLRPLICVATGFTDGPTWATGGATSLCDPARNALCHGDEP
jgi:hypothetical protein